jgi:hypothetical protein
VLVAAVTAVVKLATPMVVPIVLTHQNAAIATAAKVLARNPREAGRPFPIAQSFALRADFRNMPLTASSPAGSMGIRQQHTIRELHATIEEFALGQARNLSH